MSANSNSIGNSFWLRQQGYDENDDLIVESPNANDIKSGTLGRENFSYPSISEINGNRYSFLLGRFKAITITISKKFSFTLDELLTNPEIRQKATLKIQHILQKKIEQIWFSFLEDLQLMGDRVKNKPLPQHLKFITNCIKFVIEVGSVTEIGKSLQSSLSLLKHAENLIALIEKVTKLPFLAKDCCTGKKMDIDLTKIFDGIVTVNTVLDSFNTVLEPIYDIGTAGSALVETLDSNTFIKMAYEAAGLGENFTPFTSGIIEFWSYLDAGPFIAMRVFFKAKKLYCSGKNWYEYNPVTTNKKIEDIRLELFTCSVEMIKEMAKITVKALVIFGVIQQIPLYITIAISAVGIMTLSIRIYNYFNLDEQELSFIENNIKGETYLN